MSTNKNGQLKTVSVIVGMLVIFGSGVAAWSDVKNKAANNEKNHYELKKETNQNIKEIKTDQTTMLVQQTSLKKDISYLISMIEDLKNSN